MRKKETRDIVLVVDDSPETLRMLTDAIEEAGMTVLVAREGDSNGCSPTSS
jgi:DNA-binding response OmpR family regulator